MKRYFYQIEGNDGFHYNNIERCKCFEDAVKDITGNMESLQRITIEALEITEIKLLPE